MASVKRRDIEVEVLRIVSILGIAVFHTFLPWINALFHNMDDGVGIGVSGMTTSFTALFLLALIALLGSFGNNVFFMISGFFIMPSLEKDSRTPGYWKRQTRKTLRRIAVLVASVAIIGALCWLLSLVLPMDYFSTGVVGRFTMGLEFIWLYAIIVAFAPVFAWLSARIETWANVVAILFVTVMGLNLYVAFFDQVAQSSWVFDWRKLLSGATYLVAFLVAGVIADSWASFRRVSTIFFVGILFVTVIFMAGLALPGDRAVIGALTYKSTSVLSFLLAVGCLMQTMNVRDRHREQRAVRPVVDESGLSWAEASVKDRWNRVIISAASGILGFYIFQSLFNPVWEAWIRPVLCSVLGIAPGSASHSLPLPAGSLLFSHSLPGIVAYKPVVVLAFIAVGMLLSALYIVVTLVGDRLLRRPLLKLMRLA